MKIGTKSRVPKSTIHWTPENWLRQLGGDAENKQTKPTTL
jgi:hypothetical protein